MTDTTNPAAAKAAADAAAAKAAEEAAAAKAAEEAAARAFAERLRERKAEAEAAAVSIRFRVKDSGETVLACDEYTDVSIGAGYDALRTKSQAKEAGDADSVAICTSIVDQVAPRAREAGKAFLAAAKPLAEAALKPGGSTVDRARLKALMKGSLRAYRLANA